MKTTDYNLLGQELADSLKIGKVPEKSRNCMKCPTSTVLVYIKPASGQNTNRSIKTDVLPFV